MSRTRSAYCCAVLVVALVLLIPAVAQAQTVYVSVDGSDTAGTGTIAKPYKTVQVAVNAAASGDIVHVGAGLFDGRITMHSGISLEATGAGTGVFYTTLTTTESFAPIVTATNIGTGTHISGFKISGATSGWGISLSNSSPTISDNWVTGNMVGIACFASSTPTITGNTIEQNTGTGIVCTGSSPTILGNDILQNHADSILCTAAASPTITNNSISSNWSGSRGVECTGASSPAISGNTFGNSTIVVDCNNASPSITDNIFGGNNGPAAIRCNNASPGITGNTISAAAVGIECLNGSLPAITSNNLIGCETGINCDASSPTITDAIILGAGSTASGSGIDCLNGSSPTITGCSISDNSHNIWCSYSSPTVTRSTVKDGWFGIDGRGSTAVIANCVITGNIEGLHFDSGSTLAITNNTIAGNSSVGIKCDVTCTPTVRNCILWNPGAVELTECTATYSDVLGGAPGTGNINTDPSFVDAAAGDLHLTPGSPCIDAGTSTAAPANDRDGTPRPLFSGWDVGAFEYHPTTVRLAYVAGANGVISGTPTQIVDWDGAGTAVTAVPAVGYHFVEWSDHITANPRTDTHATADATYTATFAINTYRIHYVAATAGGSIVGSATQVVAHGSAGTTVTASPDTAGHYHFVSWSGGALTPERRETNVVADATYTANFALDTLTIVVAPCANGSIAPSGEQFVEWGASKTFSITPDVGHHIAEVAKDGSSVGASTSVTFEHVTEEGHTLAATFEINTYTLSYASGTGGVLSGSTSQTVEYNGSGTPVTAVPDTGYAFVRWSDGATTNPRIDSGVAANTSVTAEFAKVIKSASIARTPAKSRVTYTRRRGVARYTLSAVIKGWGGRAIASQYVYLQSSKNGKSWSNTYKIKTTSKGKASKAFRVTTRRVRYYRWYVPAKSGVCLKTYGKPTKVTVR